MGRLSNKIILVTGGARGQGAAEAALCVAEGAIVYIGDMLDDEGERLATQLAADKDRAIYHHLDVTDEGHWSSVVAAIEERHGRLDGLVNNAGILSSVSLEATALSEWNRVMAVNLTGAFLGIKHCARLLGRARGSSVVNIGSLAGMTGVANTVYAASKWGIRGLTKSAAMLLAGDGTRVNAVHPGLIDTPMIANDPVLKDAMAKKTPLQRLGQSEDIANLVLFLLSAEASFLNGVDIEADGGILNSLPF